MSENANVPPARVVRLAEGVRERLGRLHRRMVPAPVAVLELITAGMISQALQVAAKLGIADVLAAGPLPPTEIARRVDANPDGVHRLLRALASQGVFRADGSGRYELTPMASALRSDADVSMRSFAMYVGSPEHREHWSHLLDSVRSGEPSIEKIRGMDAWAYFEQNKELAEIFNDAMTGFSDFAQAPMLAAYDFSRFGRIVDVGGGHGSLLAGILSQAPDAKGVLFDQPSVTQGADAALRTAGVQDRCAIESGSFFEKVPAGGDAYVMKNIIHDWADDKAQAILRNVRAAIAPHGRLLLVEMVLPENNSAHPGKFTDLEMLLLVGGRERTEDDYRALLANGGFRLERVVRTASPLCVLEAAPG